MRSLPGEKSNKLIPILIGVISLFIIGVVVAIVVVLNNQNKIKSVFVDSSTIKQTYVLDEGVNLDEIHLVVVKTNGSKYTTSLTIDMIIEEDRVKLSTDGEHEIHVKYKGFNFKFNIKIINLHKVSFVVDGNIVKTVNVLDGEQVNANDIPDVEDLEGFTTVWTTRVSGEIVNADFLQPITKNILFESKYKVNISVSATEYKINTFSSGDPDVGTVYQDKSSEFELLNLDNEGGKIFDINFMSGSSTYYKGEDCVFSIVLGGKYNKNLSFQVYNNGDRVRRNNDGLYRINDIQDSINITIEGLWLNTYDVEFIGIYIDEQGDIQYQTLKSGTVNHGGSVVSLAQNIDTSWKGTDYHGGIPIFDGWTEDLSKVTRDIKIYTKYEGVQLYVVYVYQQTNNIELCETIYLAAEGNMSIPTQYATKVDYTQQYVYRFNHWEYRVLDESNSVISSNLVSGSTVFIGDRIVALVAVFDTDAKEYEVTLYGDNNVLFKKINVKYGTEEISIEKPEKLPTEDYMYIFTYWSKENDGIEFEWPQITEIEKEQAKLSLYAVFMEAPREYLAELPSGVGYECSASGNTIIAGETYNFTVTYLDAYTQSATKATVKADFWFNGVKVDTRVLSPVYTSGSESGYSIPNVKSDIVIEITGIEKNKYRVSLYNDKTATVASYSYEVEHGSSTALPDVDSYRKNDTEHLNYSCQWGHEDNYGLIELVDIKQNYRIDVIYYRNFELVIDGNSLLVEIEKGNDGPNEFSHGTYLSGGIGQDKNIGWFIDEHFTTLYTQLDMLNTMSPTLYTLGATLDKLNTNNVNERKDIYISGVVVLPRAVSSDTINNFKDCSSIKGVILPDTIKRIASDTFDGCTNLEYLVVGKTIELNSNFMPNTVKLFYMGSESDWNSIATGAGKTITSDKLYFYSVEEPDPADENNYWHFVNGKPITWDTLIIDNVRYEVEGTGLNRHAVAVEYLGNKNLPDGCLKIWGEIGQGAKVIPVTEVRSGFNNLSISAVMFYNNYQNSGYTGNMTIASGAFSGSGNFNRIYIYNSSKISINALYNSNAAVKSIWYSYRDNHTAGKYWHLVDRNPEPWSEIRIGDFIYSLNVDETAVLVAYLGTSNTLEIGTFNYENVLYYVTGLSSYAVSGNIVNIEFSLELENWLDNNGAYIEFDYDAMYSINKSTNVYLTNFKTWKNAVFKSTSANPLKNQGKLWLYDTNICTYAQVTEIFIDVGDVVGAHQYYGADIKKIIIAEGCEIKNHAFQISLIKNIEIIRNGLYTKLGDSTFGYLEFGAGKIEISVTGSTTGWSNWDFKNNDNFRSALTNP